MTKTVICLGLSYQTSPLALRERLAYPAEARDAALIAAAESTLLARAGIEELLILATCNRLELYAAGSGHHNGDGSATERQLAALQAFVSQTRAVPTADFADHCYTLAGETAVAHLCRVAAGLESMVLGEPQILGQVAEAGEAAQRLGCAGPVLDLVCRTAIRAGKRARTETGISRNAASISSLAVRVAQELIPNLSQARILVIGAGEMGQLAVKALLKRGVAEVDVLNRSQARAEALACPLGGVAFTFADLRRAMARADLVISSTSAPHLVVHAEDVRAAMAERPDRRLVLIDIAVPRDVDPATAVIPHVHLFDIDHLNVELQQALDERAREVPRVEAIIAAALADFDEQLRALAVRPIIRELRQKAEAIRQRELQRTLRQLPDVDPAMADQLHQLTRSLVNKLLHEPTAWLRNEATRGETNGQIAAVCDLFGLDGEGIGR